MRVESILFRRKLIIIVHDVEQNEKKNASVALLLSFKHLFLTFMNYSKRLDTNVSLYAVVSFGLYSLLWTFVVTTKQI